jgi:aspartyl-tRNA(Asn)/glutamyl-tRNA(Gln) amidotransferase subunit A
MTDSHYNYDILTLSRLIADKQLSPVELTKYTIRQIEKLEPLIHAFILPMPEQALEQAHLLEEEQMQGRIRGPLHGIPIAIKDIIQTQGTTTTAGSKILENWVPDEDATVISKLKQAGAILIGKANLHEFAMGATTENPHYGATRNPWDLDKIAGGSSGGCAAALAAGMAFGAIGTDTAGSIRLPSALCGTVGLKPTYGRVSRFGCLPFSWSLDHIGPMARTVKDTALLLEAISGYDPRDASSSRRSLPTPFLESLNNLKGYTIGICREYFFDEVHADILLKVDAAIARLESLGAEIQEIVIPGLKEAQWAVRIITQSEGYSFHKPMFQRLAEQYGEDVKYRLNFGQQVTADDYLKAQRIRKQFVQKAILAMENVDLLVSPMNHNPPFSINSVSPEDAINNMFRLAKAPIANLLGFPALSLPCGFIPGNLPVGLQMIGKPFAEKQLLQIGELYERSETWVKQVLEYPLQLR